MTHKNKILFDTPYFKLETIEGDISNDPYYRLTGPDSAIVCLLNSKSELLLVKQFRPSLGCKTFEFPAGSVEVGEKPLQAAAREVLEETGYKCELLSLGTYFHLMMNRTNIRDFLFIGLVEETKPQIKNESGVDVRWISRIDLLKLALNGDYRQLAGLGIMQLAGGVLGIDMWQATEKLVVDRLRDFLRSA
jgi:8-oxo-dGTP pyrophosphatase MutT (NUDIX family)